MSPRPPYLIVSPDKHQDAVLMRVKRPVQRIPKTKALRCARGEADIDSHSF